MNLAKFLKGSTTMTELMNMPNRYIQVIYKEYVNTIMDKEKSEAHQSEQMMEEMESAFTGQ